MNKLLYSFIFLVIVACGSGKNSSTSKNESASDLENQIITFDNLNLQLLSVKGDDRLEKPTEDISITLYLDVKGQEYSGNNACNRYFGNVQKIGEDQLTFKMGGSTEMMCDSLKMSWEAKYYNALMGRNFYVFTNESNAILTEVEGSTVLSFKKVEALQE